MVQWYAFLSVPKHYNSYSGNFGMHHYPHVLPTDYNPYLANLAEHA